MEDMNKEERVEQGMQGTESSESAWRSRGRKVVAFAKDHAVEIVLTGATVALGAGFIREKGANARLLGENTAMRLRIKDLVALCEEKDSWFGELMSDALRHGSSFAGKCMADRKAYLNGR